MVSLHACEDYEQEHVEAAVDSLLEDLGGLSSYVSPGQTVLLKVNLIMGANPGSAMTTHPMLVQVLASRLQASGCHVVIGDSPGGPFTKGSLRAAYEKCGMEEAAEKSGAVLSYDTDQVEVPDPDGKLLRRITMTHMVRSADKVISVCKLKTHSMMVYTGAVKNMFGTIPGLMKSEYHVRMPNMSDFADALVDICQTAAPVLSVMDAVVGMEGNGPTSGQPRHVGCLLASPSPYELDQVAAGLIGLSEKDVFTLSAAKNRGLCPEKVQVTGDDPKRFAVPDFRLPDHIHTDLSQGGFMPRWLMKCLRPKVVFDPGKCIGCGRCAENCPAKVITMKDHHPSVDYRRCIRCFCCQELCPQHAVSIHESAVYRVADGIGKSRK